MDIAIPIFDQLTALDAVGPYEVLSRLPGARQLRGGGIDMALMLAAEIAGPELAQAMQLGIEYEPEPPFRGGSPRTAAPEIVELVRARADELA